MNSFTKKLVLNCTGVIFISFMVVYFLFNMMVSSYIRGVAERELSAGMSTALGMANFIPAGMREIEFVMDDVSQPFTYVTTARIVGEQNVAITGDAHVRWHPGDLLYNAVRVQELPLSAWDTVLVEPQPAFADQFTIITGEFLMPDDLELFYVHAPSRYSMTLYPQDIMSRLAFGQVNLSRTGRPALVDTNMIMINANNEIISPVVHTLSGQGRAQVEFLVGHYLENQPRFATNAMTMVTGTNSAYYLQTMSHIMNDGLGPVSILLYADISPAVSFQRSMNVILGALLVLSGLFSLVISVAMSTKFKRAINRLCNYADAIGRGDRDQRAGTFRDAEFNRLSKSMDNMSNKLEAYENNQKQFFQNVSHELRTPLMSIQGYAEGILSDVFAKDEAADIILSEGQKMADLVGELLYVSRIDSTQAAENLAPVDVMNLLHDCVERVKPIAHKSDKKISTGTIFVPVDNIIIDADQEKFARAILNILSNAIRHAKNEVKIICGISDGRIKIVILDDGDGINPQDLPNIFERFYKGENGNYGLGLAISRDIVKSMGGVITAKNLEFPETGARFEVSFPLV